MSDRTDSTVPRHYTEGARSPQPRVWLVTETRNGNETLRRIYLKNPRYKHRYEALNRGNPNLDFYTGPETPESTMAVRIFTVLAGHRETPLPGHILTVQRKRLAEWF